MAVTKASLLNVHPIPHFFQRQSPTVADFIEKCNVFRIFFEKLNKQA